MQGVHRWRWLVPGGILCWMLFTSLGRGQEGAAPPPPTPTPETPVVEALPGPLSVDPVADCVCEPGGTASSWRSRVPPVTVFPFPGLATFPPTGKGYYSLRDWLEGNERQAPPKYPYPRVSIIPASFFDANFKYLDNPENTEHDVFDVLKRIPVGDDFMFTTGGEVRMRYANETDSRLTGRDNNYTLQRTRLYGDLWWQDRVRIFAEFIYADSFDQDLNPLLIDINRSDFLNLFTDIKLMEWENNPLYLRLGRQELLYGSQRLISTLDWANVRRTFQGAKLYYRSEKTDVDAFCVQPVPANRNHFDSVDNNQIFSGAWLTHRPRQGEVVDFYFLNLDQRTPIIRGRDGLLGPYNLSTVGSRWLGKIDNFRWEVEGALQFGPVADMQAFSQMATIGAGYDWADLPMAPQFWLYYDYASGTQDPGGPSNYSTFNQLFPFGHYYFGFIDVVGRQNINDLNGQFVFYPTKWITALAQFHIFTLDSAKDALYNAAGAPIRRDPTGRAGDDVGQELDLLLNFHVSQHADIFMSYSHLYAGQFIKLTGSPRSPDYFYLQFSYRW